MNTSINLLLQTDEESLRRKKIAKRLKFIAVIFLIGLTFSSLLAFLLNQVINASGIKKEQNDVLGKISQFQDRQAKLFVLNDRINNIEKILEKRINLSKATNALLARIPKRVLIEDLELDDKVVIMTAQSVSLSAIGELINNLTDMVRKKEIVSSLTLTALAFDEGRNSYRISIKSELSI